MFGDLDIISYIKRLRELGEDTTKFSLILDWMRQVVVTQAPELLDASFALPTRIDEI